MAGSDKRQHDLAIRDGTNADGERLRVHSGIGPGCSGRTPVAAGEMEAAMELILRNARVIGANGRDPVDIGIDGGKIVAIEAELAAEGEELDVGGRMVGPGFVETHIHLDKSCILERCKSEQGHLDEAIEQVANAKKEFSAEDCRERAMRTLEKCLRHGATHMRTHLEVDPTIGLRSLEGVMSLIDEYK